MAKTSLRQYLKQLEYLLNDGAFEPVIGHTLHILGTYPRNIAAYRMLGQALLGKSQYKEAGDVFMRVLGSVPDDLFAHAGLTEVYKDQRQFDRATWHMERAFEQSPNNVAVQDELRELYQRQQEGEYNKLQLTRAALARMYMHSNLYSKAVTELQHTLEEHPDRLDLRLLLAHALWESSHPVEAAEIATEIIETLPYCLGANRILAELWIQNNRPSDAQPFLRRVEELDPYQALEIIDRPVTDETDPYVLERLDWEKTARQMLAASAPDWMAELGDMLDSPEGLQFGSEDGSPDWMLDTAAEAGDSAPSEGVAAALAKMSGGDVPDWMAEMAPEEEAGSAAPLDLDAIDWLGEEQTPAGGAPAAADAALDEALESDWMADVQPAAPDAGTPAVTPIPDDAPALSPDWMADVQAAALDSAPESDAMEGLDWLDGEAEEDEEDEEPLETDWMAELESPDYVPAEPGERIPTGFTGLLNMLPDEVTDDEALDAALKLFEAEEAAAAPVDAEDMNETTGQLRSMLAGDDLSLDDMFEADDAAGMLDAAPVSDDPLAAFLTSPDPVEAAAAAESGEDDALAWLYAGEDDVVDALVEPSAGLENDAEDDPLNWLYAQSGDDAPAEGDEPMADSRPDFERPEDDLDKGQPEWMGSTDEESSGDSEIDEELAAFGLDFDDESAPEAADADVSDDLPEAAELPGWMAELGGLDAEEFEP
ncbi:MAG: hypothetical protein JXN59_12690, partial [Anaerolineae bacterium]|nr:hypothetical protein [Anaerolineae bacterium]